jgi:DNA-binding transcriptional ArsR family regulator
VELNAALAAIADPCRRQIVQRLMHGPATTGQLAELFPISRPAVSQHLKVLQEAGLIGTTAAGRHRWHELHTGPLADIVHWASQVITTYEKDAR